METKYSTCVFCDGGCRVKAEVDGDRLRVLPADPAFPAICPKAGMVDAYRLHPDRVTVPLKRAGKRGEGKWKAIGWDQLIKEVTEGGKLFAEIGEDHDIEGFKAVHDTVTPINPEQPDLGPKSNQIIIWNTRADGRRQLNARFAQTFGTVNNFSHNSS